MTETRDFDRLARAWLDLMPDEAPDRVIDAVLQAVDVTPQRRPPFDPAIRRFFPMNRLTYAAVAVAIVLLGGGALLLTQFRQSNVGPSQGPTATPVPSPSAPVGANLPATLVHKWFGPNRSIPGLLAGAGVALDLQDTVANVEQANQQQTSLLVADVSIVDGQLHIATRVAGPHVCEVGQAGTYTYSISSSGQTMTLTAAAEACSTRRTALEGTWWQIDCRNGETECLGAMDAGTYKSQYFRPIRAGAPWAPMFGGLTFTVPAGWASDTDQPWKFGLAPDADFQKTSPNNAAVAHHLLVLSQVSAESQASPCSGQVQPGVAHTAAAIIAWLRTLPSLHVGAASAVTVGSLSGTAVDLSINASKAPKCDADPLVEYLIAGTGDTWHEGFAIASERQRLILLDVGPNEVVAISLYVQDSSGFDAFAAAARPIIASLQFK